MPLEEVYEYFRNYDGKTFEAVACRGHEPSERTVAAFERKVGFTLPSEYRQFTMSSLGGLYFAVREEFWPRPKEFDVGEFWSFLYGIKVFGIAKDIPEWLDVREQWREFREEGRGDLVPFLQLEGDVNCYCFDRDGRIIAWDHEQPERRDPATHQSFSALLMDEIRDLEKRQKRKLRQKARRRK